MKVREKRLGPEAVGVFGKWFFASCDLISGFVGLQMWRRERRGKMSDVRSAISGSELRLTFSGELLPD